MISNDIQINCLCKINPIIYSNFFLFAMKLKDQMQIFQVIFVKV